MDYDQGLGSLTGHAMLRIPKSFLVLSKKPLLSLYPAFTLWVIKRCLC